MNISLLRLCNTRDARSALAIVATVWEGAEAGGKRYREYSDDDVGESLTWEALPLERLQADAYVLVYVRTRFWNEGVGDGSERTPYLRDRASVEVARRYFRGRLAHVASAQDLASSGAAPVIDRPADGAFGSGGSSAVLRA